MIRWRSLLTVRNLALAGTGILLLAAASGAAASTGQVAAVHAPNYPRGQGAQFARYLQTLLASRGITGEPAVLFITHVCRETGSGSAVYDYNFGNIHATSSWPGAWYRNGGDSGARFRAYASDGDGIDDAIAFLRDNNGGRYAQAWAMLLVGNVEWYRELGLAGYYGNVTLDRADPARIAVADAGQADYENTLATVRRWLGA